MDHLIKMARAIIIAPTMRMITNLRRLFQIMPAKGPSILGQRKPNPNQKLEDLERWSANATLLILFGILLEIALILYFPHDTSEKIGSIAADALIGVGLIIEYVVILRAITASGEAQREADQKIATAEYFASQANSRAGRARREAAKINERAAQLEKDAKSARAAIADANARAAEANRVAEEEKHARLKLEAQLAPRSLTEEQFNILQKLRGKIAAVNVAAEVGLEPSWFATQVATALHKAGIEVRMFWRGPHAHSSGNLLFDKNAFHSPEGARPTFGGVLEVVLREAKIWDGGLMAVMPQDIDAPLDIPLLIIGGKFAIATKAPYMGTDDKNTMPPITVINP